VESQEKKQRAIWITLLSLAVLWLRFTGLRWGAGTIPHPDEIRIAYAVDELFRSFGNPKFFAYGHLPIYLQAGLFKLRGLLHLTSGDHLLDITTSGRMVAAALSLGTIFLSGRVALLLGLPFWYALAAAFGASFFPLAVQLSQFSTVDAQATFFTLLAIERTLVFRTRGRWRDILTLSLALGGALACKANSLPLAAILLFFLLPFWRTAKFWVFPLATLFCFSLFEPYAWIDWKGFVHDLSEQARWVRGSNVPVFFEQYENSLPFLFAGRDLFFYSVGPAGFLLSLYGFFRSLKRRESWLLAAWFVVNIVLLGTSYAKFSRYWLPVIPAFAIYAAWGLLEIRKFLPKIAGVAIAVLFVAQTVLTGALTHTIHLQVHSNRKAAELVEKAIPGEGPPIRVMYDSLWVGFPSLPGGLSKRSVVNDFAQLFESETDPQYPGRIARKLAAADLFITINHMSIRSAFEQAPHKYVQAQTFEALRHQGLGYRFVAAVTIRPPVLPGLLRDFSLDYSIPIYDHPTIFIWRNEEGLSPLQIEQAILDTNVSSPRDSLAYYECLSEEGPDCDTSPPVDLSPSRIGTHPASTDNADLDPILAPRLWVPVAWYLFFFLTGLAAWPLVRVLFPGSFAAGYGISRTIGWIVFGYALWLLGHLPGELLRGWSVRIFWLAALAWGAYGWKKTELWKNGRWKEALPAECLLFVTFLLFFAYRLFAPDVFWSENPIDLGYLSVLAKTGSLPPPDPGYSGTSLNYYYYGFFLFSLPMKILAVPPNIADFLGMVTIPSLIAGLLMTIGASLDFEKPKPLLGLLSVVLVLLVGNWDGASHLVRYFLRRDPYPWNFDVFHSVHGLIRNTVHETPLFSYLFVDLHAHLMSGILFLAFLAWLRFSDLMNLSRFQLVIGAILLGSMGPANTWDFFSLSVLILVITTLLAIHRRELPPLKKALGFLSLSYLLFSPFYLIFTKKMTQLGVGWVGRFQTELSGALLTMGLFLTFILLVQFSVWKELVQKKLLWISLTVVAGLLAVAFTIAGFTHLFPFTFLLYSLLGAGFAVLAVRRAPRFPYLDSRLLVFFSLTILSTCEIFFIKDFLQGGEFKRMNTIFKFYYQVWLLFAVASPSLLYALLTQTKSAWVRIALSGVALLSIFAGMIWTVGTVKARTHEHTFAKSGEPMFTFDGLAWLKRERPHEYKTIAWLWKHGTSRDVILEASKEDYHYDYNVVSCASGVPAVLSWWSHADQRDRPSGDRVWAINAFYKTQDIRIALRVLRRFHVTYVYVADRELEQYGPEGMQKFRERPDIFVPVVTTPQSALYRINW
jgi:YYY domain-containing protein